MGLFFCPYGCCAMISTRGLLLHSLAERFQQAEPPLSWSAGTVQMHDQGHLLVEHDFSETAVPLTSSKDSQGQISHPQHQFHPDHHSSSLSPQTGFFCMQTSVHSDPLPIQMFSFLCYRYCLSRHDFCHFPVKPV